MSDLLKYRPIDAPYFRTNLAFRANFLFFLVLILAACTPRPTPTSDGRITAAVQTVSALENQLQTMEPVRDGLLTKQAEPANLQATSDSVKQTVEAGTTDVFGGPTATPNPECLDVSLVYQLAPGEEVVILNMSLQNNSLPGATQADLDITNEFGTQLPVAILPHGSVQRILASTCAEFDKATGIIGIGFYRPLNLFTPAPFATETPMPGLEGNFISR